MTLDDDEGVVVDDHPLTAYRLNLVDLTGAELVCGTWDLAVAVLVVNGTVVLNVEDTGDSVRVLGEFSAPVVVLVVVVLVVVGLVVVVVIGQRY